MRCERIQPHPWNLNRGKNECCGGCHLFLATGSSRESVLDQRSYQAHEGVPRTYAFLASELIPISRLLDQEDVVVTDSSSPSQSLALWLDQKIVLWMWLKILSWSANWWWTPFLPFSKQQKISCCYRCTADLLEWNALGLFFWFAEGHSEAFARRVLNEKLDIKVEEAVQNAARTELSDLKGINMQRKRMILDARFGLSRMQTFPANIILVMLIRFKYQSLYEIGKDLRYWIVWKSREYRSLRWMCRVQRTWNLENLGWMLKKSLIWHPHAGMAILAAKALGKRVFVGYRYRSFV